MYVFGLILAVKNLKTRHQGSVARADNIWTFCSCIKCRLKSFLPAHHHYWHHFRVHNFVFNANHESCIIHEQDLKASLSTRLQGIYNSHYGNGVPAMAVLFIWKVNITKKPHCRNGVLDMFGLGAVSNQERVMMVLLLYQIVGNIIIISLFAESYRKQWKILPQNSF